MQEIWKPVDGFEGIYEVSNYGRVKSLARDIDHNGFIRHRKERILKPIRRNRQGYMSVNLYTGKHQFTMYAIHRLVGAAFLPNPDGLPFINHKDENPMNNRADNLEWCTQTYNTNYGTCPARIARALSKPIKQKQWTESRFVYGNRVRLLVGLLVRNRLISAKRQKGKGHTPTDINGSII